MFMITRHRRGLALLASCSLVMALPAPAQDLKCFILTPPQQILPGVKRIAIADFSVVSSYKYDDQRPTAAKTANTAPSQDRFAGAGAKLSDMMIAALLEKDRGVREISSGPFGMGKKKEGMSFQEGAFTNIFTVVERSEIERVMKELALSQSGIVNDADAAQAGKILGVEAMIVGSVKIDCEQKWLSEERKEGNQTKRADCEHMATNVSGAIRIVQVETGQVIASKDSRRAHDQKGCKGATLADPSKASEKKSFGLGNLLKSDKSSTVTSPEAAVDLCLTEIITELADYIAPAFQEQKLEFADVEGDEFKRKVEAAKEALKSPSLNNLNTAYAQYAAIIEQDTYNHGAQFNLGVLYEAVGNYKKAKEKYDLAYSMKSNDNKYRKAQERLTRQVEFWDALNALGVVLQPYEFVVSEKAKADLSLSRIQTKGPSKVRHEIKAEPNGASATIARVPGEIELIMLETVTGWYKVRLPDGKEGFLSQEMAKAVK